MSSQTFTGLGFLDGLPTFARSASLPVKVVMYTIVGVLLFACLLRTVKPVRTAIVFAYTCFLQPIGRHAKQSERLDRFYQNQAQGKQTRSIFAPRLAGNYACRSE